MIKFCDVFGASDDIKLCIISLLPCHTVAQRKEFTTSCLALENKVLTVIMCYESVQCFSEPTCTVTASLEKYYNDMTVDIFGTSDRRQAHEDNTSDRFGSSGLNTSRHAIH